MPLSVGIIGFPNAGKSTLFKALTKREVRIEPRPFSTVEPNVGIIGVPDQRFKKLAQTLNPPKKTPATIEFWDIAGLVKEAHKGEGLGNQFLAQIRNCPALTEVIRTFKNKEVAHIEQTVDPERDHEIIKTELIMKDLETASKALSKLDHKSLSKEDKQKKQTLLKIKKILEKGQKIEQVEIDEEAVKEFQFLTQKPTIYLLNKGYKNAPFKKDLSPILRADLQMEVEMAELSKKEKQELGIKSVLPQLIASCYEVLDLITFYTVKGGEEARAWPLKEGGLAVEAAGKVHSDFEQNFIRAEVISWNKLIKFKDFKKAKEQGEVKTVGRDYEVKDGDVIEFKI